MNLTRKIALLYFSILFSIVDSHAQSDSLILDKPRLKHILGVYNIRDDEHVKMQLRTRATIFRFAIDAKKRHVEDSLNLKLIEDGLSSYQAYLKFRNGEQWNLDYGPPRNPRILKRYKSKDYEITEDKEAQSWIHYMQILEHIKRYNEFPIHLVKSMGCSDTLIFENRSKYYLEYEYQYEGDSIHSRQTELIPIK